MPFVPRSKRGTAAEAEHLALQEGVPEHIATSLYNWVQEQLLVEGMDGYGLVQIVFDVQYLRRIELEMQAPLGTNDDRMVDVLLGRCYADPEWHLDLIDYLLRNPIPLTTTRDRWFRSPDERARQLEEYLSRGRSAWKVAPFGDKHELVRRVEETVELTVNKAVALDAAAGAHLMLAWHVTYGRSPNPSESYRESIKAVEAASITVIIPRDRTATLGKVLGEMRSTLGRWTVEVPARSATMPGESLIIAMMDALWTGQLGRHGTPAPSPLVVQSQAEAEAALHLAATLVHWFASGTIQCSDRPHHCRHFTTGGQNAHLAD